jgi:hypothetical protein
MCAMLSGMTACTIGGGPPVGDHNTLGRICTTQFSTAGTFAPDTANLAPAGYTGCWPIGVWTFSATQVANDCQTPPTLLSQYQIKAELVPDPNGTPDPVEQFSYVTDPATMNHVKITQGGSGLCEGEVDLYSIDGLQLWAFKPELNADNTITGDGEYGLYKDSQW